MRQIRTSEIFIGFNNVCHSVGSQFRDELRWSHFMASTNAKRSSKSPLRMILPWEKSKDWASVSHSIGLKSLYPWDYHLQGLRSIQYTHGSDNCTWFSPESGPRISQLRVTQSN
jgi:hypothetical protein